MIRLLISAALLAVLATALPFEPALQPAWAQFDWIFGSPPPRPPGSVPGGNVPPSRQPPDQAAPPPGRLPPPPVAQPRRQPVAQPRQPRSAPSTARRSPGIQSQPLPPPPGSAPAPAAPVRQPQQALPSRQPQFATPPVPGQPPAAPQQANVAPQPDDVTVTEMPTQKIANKRAVFSGLDKITGRIISFDVAIDETVQFGALQVTPKVCYTRPPTEKSNTDAFLQVDEVTLQGEVRRIFSGWMFAASPGMHAVEHPIYDVWLTGCKDPADKVAVTQDSEKKEPPPTPPKRPRRR